MLNANKILKPIHFLILGLLVMSNHSQVKAEEGNTLTAWIDAEHKNGFLHITPTIQWISTVTAIEAHKYSYHLSVIKDGT